MGHDEDTGSNPDAKAAHEFLAELRTRISIQPLAYQDGDETRALESLVEIFGFARAAIKSNPGCEEFARKTSDMLNTVLRPVTAKWHPRSIAGELKTRDGASEFRSDLAALRLGLRDFADTLHRMAYDSDFADLEMPPVISREMLDRLFEDLPYGIPAGHLFDDPVHEGINESEALEIAARRGTDDKRISNAVGLALSGGGVRSASFCLGACQSLADHGMLKDVDVMSTVSGGGYAGAFISRQMAANTANPVAPLMQRDGPDTDAIRKLRTKVKYLSPSGFVEKWSMICSLVAGMLVNWVGLAAILSFVVLIVILTQSIWQDAQRILPMLALIAFAAALIVFAVSHGRNRTRAIRRFSVLAAIAAVLIVVSLISPLYALYRGIIDAEPAIGAVALAVSASLPTVARIAGLVTRRSAELMLMRAALVVSSIAVPIICLFFSFALWDLATNPLGVKPLVNWFGVFGLVALTVFLGLIAAFTLDVNLTGPGRLYRNRLARSFVATTREGDTFLPLIDLNIATDEGGDHAPGKAPYHLINATVNLPTSRSPVLRERKGDFFIMSKFWTGSPSTEYFPTGEWKTRDGDLDLATAIATSGAAVSPHMSLMSIPSIAGLIAFLNLRLGLWIRKPGGGDTSLRAGFPKLLREMFSVDMDETGDWLLLSDGAHVDNSGIYELLRRRCKFIIACDASADNDDSFATLMTVVRHAQIDFGIQMMPRLEELRADFETGHTAAHTLMCRIKYPGEADGLLLVLKSSVTGNESEFIRTYRAANPDFPNQSTLDQNFDEAQFEAYRQLGAHAVDGLFVASIIGPESGPATVSDWFRRLAMNLLPRQA
ncbi:hypothetical protein K3722_04225 [Leisingera caerulea]|uniref:PNPLA domain-containing protein n=1 Tax=Leisingera caerulea TaxID=506591 RepID=A0ABY5WYD2_LEICA|nr:patatin-like phospholipase family protein [Leisingera caerulea]UWQ59342.1 hypothetical protein K3722_04225 [Leisingera caerulea]